MRNTINYTNIQKVVRAVGAIGAQTRLQDAIGVEEASKVFKAFCDVKRARVSEEIADRVMATLLEQRALDMPVVPEKEEGDVLFLTVYEAFPLQDGTVIPNGVTIKYSLGGRDYTISKTRKEYAQNILTCYHNTKNEEVRKKFEYAVNGHLFENPVTSLFNNREFFKDEPVFKELRKSKEVEWTEYNPFGGLDEEQVAILKAQRDDFELRHWGNAVLQSLEAIRPLMSTEPIKAIELIKLIAEQLGDMTKLDNKEKRCSEYLEDSYCDDNSWELDLVKREVRVAPKEREYRWALKRDITKMAREEQADVVLKWIVKWAPTETAQSPDIKGDSFRIARAIAYSQASKLFCQRKFADRWEEALAILRAYNQEADNAYIASELVLRALANGRTLEEALNRSVYRPFLDASEKLEVGELDKNIILNWVKSQKIEKFDKLLRKVETAYKEARQLQLETRQVELLGELKELLTYRKQGGEVAEGRFESIRKQNKEISCRLEALREGKMDLAMY